MKVIEVLMKQPEFGKMILELRQKKGLTQSELADICKLSLRTVQRIESCQVTPRSYTIKLIFSNLDCDYEHSISNQALVFQKNWLKQVFFNIIEIFNFKKNTMKKLSVLSLVAILVTAGLFLAKSDIKAQKIEGWYLAGSNPKSYKIGLDKSIYMTGSSSAFLESIDKDIKGFGTLMQSCFADDYLGKRVKMTAYIKSNDVSEQAGMWLRVDSKEQGKVLGFDNMQDRPIIGSKDWTKYEIILDVPEESASISFGVLLRGTGKIWFDDISFEIVDKMTETTGNRSQPNKKPTNLDFK
jgi:transcriptional regulator with XRE-family HTH domain